MLEALIGNRRRLARRAEERLAPERSRAATGAGGQSAEPRLEAWDAQAWARAAAHRVIPDLLEVRDGRLDLAVVGERETCLALLHRVGRIIGRPFDAPLPLILRLSDAGLDAGPDAGPNLGPNADEDARFAVFAALFKRQRQPTPGRRLLVFLALPGAHAEPSRIAAVTAGLAGAGGLMVLSAPASAAREDAIASHLLAAGWLPLFLELSRTGMASPGVSKQAMARRAMSRQALSHQALSHRAISGRGPHQAPGPGGLDSERLGRIIHEMFLENAWTRGERRGATPALHPWRRLDETYRIANRSQAEHIAVKLASGGLIATQEPVVADGSQAPLWSMPEFIEPLSRMEHDRWASDRLLDGWTYAPKRDNAARHHPDLIPYDDLSEDIREKDRVAVATIPFILQLGGFGWRPLAPVKLVGSWPEPGTHGRVRRQWRRDLARAARERAPAVLEFLLDPRDPRQCHVGILLAEFGFPVSLWLPEQHPVASLAADASARAALLHCLARCRQVVWDADLPLAPATPSTLEAMVVERGGLRIERHLTGAA